LGKKRTRNGKRKHTKRITNKRKRKEKGEGKINRKGIRMGFRRREKEKSKIHEQV
jgi:hypothetical protein